MLSKPGGCLRISDVIVIRIVVMIFEVGLCSSPPFAGKLIRHGPTERLVLLSNLGCVDL